MRIMSMGVEEKYKKLFKNLETMEAPRDLEARIVLRIDAEEKRISNLKTWVFGSSTLASFGLSLWAVVYLVKSANQSGFGQYFSLIFSENGSVFAYWRELSLALAESLPITSLIMFLTAIGFFIWSTSKVIGSNTKIFNMNFN